jgi:hypothetical protein
MLGKRPLPDSNISGTALPQMSFNKIVVRDAWEHNLKGFEGEMPRWSVMT